MTISNPLGLIIVVKRTNMYEYRTYAARILACVKHARRIPARVRTLVVPDIKKTVPVARRNLRAKPNPAAKKRVQRFRLQFRAVFPKTRAAP